MSDTTDLGEVTYTRVYGAPRELVFECMTTPEHLTQFWGPTGTSTPLDGIKIDLRPGGIFETAMVNDADGERYVMTGEYTVVEPPSRLGWREPGPAGGIETTVTFTDLGDGRTEVVIHQVNLPAMYRTPEAQAGFQTSLDRFAAYLATLAA
jgi:uncharacterized protein YndB with AHSA1/START domain